MPNNTGNSVQALWVANMKSRASITSLLASGTQIKELEWQGTDFVYPGIRLSVEFIPGINGCLDEANLEVTVFSEEKSSNEASTIAAAIQQEYHRKPFSQGGVQFPTVIVRKVRRPNRTVYAWEVMVEIHTQVA